MTLDFDVVTYCRNLLKTSKQPPFNCPVAECSKSYKTMCGLQYHLVNFDHENQEKPVNTPVSSPAKASSKKKKVEKSPEQSEVTTDMTVKSSTDKLVKSSTDKTAKSPTNKTEKLSVEKNGKFVEFELDDKTFKVSADEPLSVISTQNYELLNPTGSSYMKSTPEASKSKEMLSKLPTAFYTEVSDYNISKAPPKPLGYIRYIEKNIEDMDGEVEYDIDEEDAAWLELINQRRNEQNLNDVTVDMFELLMDRLEKESFFLMTTNTKGDVPALIDDDAVCCICMDGECQNSNVILFCDMCNLAVHQDCYGVPYIPEGQWLCRRCLQSPSRAVDCVLCPNNGGAFKQTDRGHWAHVVCALWIPEVRFANTVFLEPIDSIETIPSARWKLTCCLCKQRGVGACIQCHKPSCYAAFHVTCAQLAGLYMKMDAVKDPASSDSEAAPVVVEKIAFCTAHTPPDAPARTSNAVPKQIKNTGKPTAPPVINIPTIPPDRIQEIGSLVNLNKKNQFIQRLIAYWTLKRQLRNGVPLLRRLQPTNWSRRGETADGQEVDLNELRRQFKYWQSLRQDLERARLLSELVRKREKLKRELLKVKEQCMELQLCPLVCFLRRLLDLLRSRDTGEIFVEPVDLNEVPDYTDVVKHPMDLSTMRKKVDSFQYNNLKEFEGDFNLMINNCLAYNSKETVFYRAALKMREQGGALLKQAQKDLLSMGIENSSDRIPSVTPDRNSKEETSTAEIDAKISKLSSMDNVTNYTERLKELEALEEECSSIKSAISRKSRVKSIHKLIASCKRKRTNEEKETEVVVNEPRPKRRKSVKVEAEEEEEEEEEPPPPPPKSTGRRRGRKPKEKKDVTQETPVKSTRTSNGSIVSPSGVNRRTAVLFTRKAAAAAAKNLSSPPDSPKESPRKSRSSKSSLPFNFSKNSDSFSAYRGGEEVKSDVDDGDTDAESSCSDCESGSSRTSSDWSDSEGRGESAPMEALDQLQLVWAKCRGYPWYPALIINPAMPPGYMHNGVPIPTPPADVIALANNYTEPVYLVLFFDTKRTWQWLPRNKLEPLGITYELDYMKLTESRKPTDRKAVKKAFQEAMMYRTQMDKNADGSQSADT